MAQAERAGVAALIGELTDPTRKANQWSLPGSNIADAELSHCQVEDGVPGALRQSDDRTEQRD